MVFFCKQGKKREESFSIGDFVLSIFLIDSVSLIISAIAKVSYERLKHRGR